ncbi:hypothetical protein Tco_0946998 [Tanacetum coccineum]
MLAIQAEECEGSGHPSKPQPPPSPAQPTNEEPIPNVTSEPIPNVQDEAVYEEWDDKVENDTTTAASLDAEQASSNINRTQSTAIPNVPLLQGVGAGGSPRCQEPMGGSIAQTRFERVPTPPRDSHLPKVNTLGSDEDSMTLQELTVLCTTLSKKVESLEADLKQTKQVYGAAYTKLIIKVKKLENTVKTSHSRRRAKIVVSDDEEALEYSSKQGRMIEEIDQNERVTLVTPTQGEDQPEDQLGVLSAAKILADAAKINVHTYTRRRRAVSTGSGGISTASRLFSTAEESVSTAGASMQASTAGIVQEVNISIPSPVVIKDKGKGKMEESKDEQIKRTKLQQEQDRLGHEAAVRLQEELDKEERQRMTRVHEAAQSFTEEEWENIRARKYFAAQKAEAKRNKPMTQAQQRNYMINYIKHMGSRTLQQLKRYSFDEIKELFETTMKNVNTFVPMENEDRGRASELAAGSSQATVTNSTEVGRSVKGQPDEEEKELSQEDLQMMMMVVLVEEVYVEALQKDSVQQNLLMTKKEHYGVELKRVHHVSTERGTDIFMLLEKEYPLSKGVLTLMLVNRLLIEQHSEMIMSPRMRTQSAGRPVAESRGGGMAGRVGRGGGRGRRPREGNDKRVDDLNGQGNEQGMGANRVVEGVNGNVEGANRGAPDFSTIIAQQLQNLLPAMLAQVSNRGNIGNHNGNVVNEKV